MLASLAEPPLEDPQLVYEPKYDGIRAIVDVPAGGRGVRLWSRLGNEKTAQFPEIAGALEQWARRLRTPLVLDGEIVALDASGEPTGFQQLQGRIHLDEQKGKAPLASGVAFIAFDLLRLGAEDLRERPLLERRAALERIIAPRGRIIRLSEMARGDGRTLYARALAHGWEGIIAKHADSRYRSGKRTPDWRKLKIIREQEFVVGGWTEPRQTRVYFGALLLGVYDDRGELAYAGHTGTGFDERELGRLMKLLRPLETKTCPFRGRPPSNERPHWVEPTLVVQVKFTEWTADGRLRHPVYVGLRDDKKATEVRREEQTRLHAATKVRLTPSAEATAVRRSFSEGGSVPRRPKPDAVPRRGSAAIERVTPEREHARTSTAGSGGSRDLEDQLRALEESRRDGWIDLPGGDRLAVTNLHKIFWPRQKLTKGDLLRHYARAAPFILPAVADRPLVMKRYPSGIAGQPFYQHRAPDVPAGVRVDTVKAAARRPYIVGGDLKTLLYMTQLAAISQDPWFSRVQTAAFADHVALDLDPMPGVAFARVLDVARWIRDELRSLGVAGVPKTSGADGLHIYVPLPPATPYEAGLLFCQIVATVVANKHPRQATIERAVRARGARVYVDYLQNIPGKTLATAYSARASAYAGVSTPLAWREIEEGVRREDFTIQSFPSRLKAVGDLWAALRNAKGADLSRVASYTRRRS
jgi:bifunctional non-homologous end joining protein LigD